jgi:photosystem II stability/assembly factor-like uncharacterized protein
VKSILITCAVLLLACAQAWSQYSYCFPYGKGEFFDVAFVNRDTGMAIGRIGVSVVLRTTNSGASWDTTALPPTPGKKKIDAVIDYNSRVVLHKNGTAMVFSRYATYTTGDFGRTWGVLPYYTETYPGSLFDRSRATYFKPQLFDDSLVYANVGAGGILRSTDLGRTWVEIIHPDSSFNGPYLMTFASSTHGWISGSKSLLETTDGCITFHPRSDKQVGRFQSLNDSLLVRYGSNEWFLSKDSGATWTKHLISQLQQYCSAAVFVDTSRICFSQDYHLYASKDGGKNVYSTKLNPGDEANAMCIADSLTYFAAMRFGIIRITNGGFPDTTTSVQDPDSSPPFRWSVSPNPSGEDVVVRVSLDAPSNVFLRVTTIDGRLVIDRELGVVQPGTITEHLALASGSYLCTCTVGTHRQTTPISITR